MTTEIYILLSFCLGAVIGWLISQYIGSQADSSIKEDLYRYKAKIDEAENSRKEQEKIRQEFEHIFKSLASDISQKNTQEFLKMASDKFKSLSDESSKNLDEKKKLIDLNLIKMNEKLDKIDKHSTELSTSINDSKQETEKLKDSTIELKKILSSSQKRGKWGERMVDDILSVIGLIENINYKSQKMVDSGDIPDYTFYLPREKSLNMDVKFPLDNYEKYINANSPESMDQYKTSFFLDIKKHINDVSKRGYIDSSTLDYVLIFIPNESIYGFINKEKPDIIDDALSKKILLCSPLTLYAILSLIHQSSKNFAIEEKAQEIMGYMHEFKKQWDLYVVSMEKVGKSLDSARKEYDRLTSTRTRQLEKPLQKIETMAQSSIDTHDTQPDSGTLFEEKVD